jgi:hypothetical protein
MTNSIEPLARFLGLTISLFSSYWVWQDASHLKKNGANLTPIVWCLLVLFLWLVSLPIYLLMRRTTWRSHVSSPHNVNSGSTETGESPAKDTNLEPPSPGIA